jgi:hypothetical protein
MHHLHRQLSIEFWQGDGLHHHTWHVGPFCSCVFLTSGVIADQEMLKVIGRKKLLRRSIARFHLKRMALVLLRRVLQSILVACVPVILKQGQFHISLAKHFGMLMIFQIFGQYFDNVQIGM